jgi:large subunit ribosomal protein L4
MPKVALLSQNGQNVGEIELLDSVFGIEPNEHALYDVVKAQRAAMRQGTQKAKTRGEIRGGGRKPWKQKGTGRARAGTLTSPIFRGGGTIFAPTPRDYSMKVNRKVRRLALKSVLSQKVANNTVTVLDKLELSEVKTKGMAAVVASLELSGKVAFVCKVVDENVALAARNIPGITVTTVNHVSVYELMNYKNVVLTQDAVKQYEEVLG